MNKSLDAPSFSINSQSPSHFFKYEFCLAFYSMNKKLIKDSGRQLLIYHLVVTQSV